MRTRRPVAAAAGALALLVALTPSAWAKPPDCFGKRPTILGTPEDDTISGTPGRDVIYTDGGNDVIKGRGGNDLICPGAGEDDVYGQGGNDKLDAGGSSGATEMYGGRGNDLLFDDPHDDDSQSMFGGPGDDVLKAGDNNGTDTDTLDGGPGDDVMEQGSSHSVFVSGPGNDVMRAGELGGTDDYDFLDYTNAPAGVVVDLEAGTATGDGSDTVEGFEYVFGSKLDDRLVGDDEPNLLVGQEGNDTIEGRGGNDCLMGGASPHKSCFSPRDTSTQNDDDVLLGEDGDDFLTGSNGDDSYEGGGGLDIASFSHAPTGVHVDLELGTATGEGTDSLSEIDTVLGSRHADELLGDSAPNRLDAGTGSGDVVRGRAGADTLTNVGGDGTVDGGEGIDTISYNTELSAPRGHIVVNLATGTDSESNDILGIEDVQGAVHLRNDITGDDGPNELVGGGRDDAVNGGSGDDILRGGHGDDTLDGGPGSDEIDGAQGHDTCTNGEQVTSC